MVKFRAVLVNTYYIAYSYFFDVYSLWFRSNCGQLLPLATPVEIPCPVGTYNSEENGQGIEACRPCTAGYYCLEKTVTPTLKCDHGYYCPTNITDGVSSLLIGSYGPKQVPCPKATYTDIYGTTDVGSCKTCTIGHYCREGTPTPVTCPRGYYCPANISDPQPCPLGTYGHRTGLHFRENCTQCTRGW